MRFSLKDGIFPLLTTKFVPFRVVLEEALFFIRGQTSNKILNDKNIHIWDGNSTKEYFEKYGIDRKPGDLGPVYGFQWRHWGAEYKSCNDDYSGKGIDQLQNIVDEIKSNSQSRRLVVSAWNPTQIGEMALPPCHCLFQFYVANGRLSCMLYQRSGDLGLGIPFNIASYSIITVIIAKLCNLELGEFVHTIGDAHVYLNHIDSLKIQLERVPKKFPTLSLKNKKYTSFEDFEFEDFILENYEYHPKIVMKMSE